MNSAMNLLLVALPSKQPSSRVANSSIGTSSVDLPSKELDTVDSLTSCCNPDCETLAVDTTSDIKPPLSPSPLRSCLKRSAHKQCGRQVTFSNVIDTCNENPVPFEVDDLDDLNDLNSRTLWTTSDTLDLSILRDQTLIRTEGAAWSYAWAYDAAYLQFFENSTKGFAASVDRGLQRALVWGIHHDYLTLERFSGDSRARNHDALCVRRAILDEYWVLRQHGVDDWDMHLSRYCQDASRVHRQWARFMGSLVAAATKIQEPVPAAASPPVEVAKKGRLVRWRTSFRRQPSKSKRQWIEI
jgi:hypothetical protein